MQRLWLPGESNSPLLTCGLYTVVSFQTIAQVWERSMWGGLCVIRGTWNLTKLTSTTQAKESAGQQAIIHTDSTDPDTSYDVIKMATDWFEEDGERSHFVEGP
jgi:hypothetical protein